MLVSVIVPVYNVERYLRKCLDSLKDQTLQDIEFICVNDGSTDRSLDILEEYALSDSRFKILSKSNGGYGQALNTGIKQAEGEYIGFVESDDFCKPAMFERLSEVARMNDLDIVRSSYYLYWSAPEIRCELVSSSPREACNRVFNPREYTECFYFHPAIWSMLIRSRTIMDNELKLLETPGASYQDTSFSFKLWACSRRAMVLQGAFLFYRQDNEESSINQQGKIECVPEEYREVEHYLLSKGKKDTCLLPIMMKRKFMAYLWNYERLSNDLHLEFAVMVAKEFCEAAKDGWLKKDLFSSNEWSDMCLIARDPQRFVALHDNGSSSSLHRFYIAERLLRAFKMNRGISGS